MSDSIFLHQHSEFKELISIIARQLEIDPYLAEKDYWIMHCLFGLQQAGYDFQLKGGTSLSKGYKIIDRFSEDIDIHITPPADLELKTGKNHNKSQHVEARKVYYDSLAKEISIVGTEASRSTDFDDERYYRSGGIRLTYETQFQTNPAAKEGVLLELGFDDVAPNAPIDISSWAYDHAVEQGVEVIDNRAKGVLCYEAGYTFVEKLQTIATKYRNYKVGGAFPENFMRHYYDVYCLLQEKSVLKFIGTDGYQAHKEKRFPKTDLAIPIAENQAFLLADTKDFQVFKKEYEGKEALYYSGQPDFEKVIGEIRKYVSTL